MVTTCAAPEGGPSSGFQACRTRHKTLRWGNKFTPIKRDEHPNNQCPPIWNSLFPAWICVHNLSQFTFMARDGEMINPQNPAGISIPLQAGSWSGYNPLRVVRYSSGVPKFSADKFTVDERPLPQVQAFQIIGEFPIFGLGYQAVLDGVGMDVNAQVQQMSGNAGWVWPGIAPEIRRLPARSVY